jgi:hypothetical protein
MRFAATPLRRGHTSQAPKLVGLDFRVVLEHHVLRWGTSDGNMARRIAWHRQNRNHSRDGEPHRENGTHL